MASIVTKSLTLYRFGNLLPLKLSRNLTRLRRQYPITVPQYITANGGVQELTVEQRIYIECEQEKEDPVIEVLLTDNVPGLGAKGNLVKIHRNRFWDNLYLRGLAELPTEERIKELKSDDESVLYGHAYEAQQRLLNMILYIPMNPSTSWTLTANNVKVAFRRMGVVVSEEDITLPENPVTPSTLEEFIVHVNIQNKASVPVKCRIFLYQRLDAKTTTKPPANTFRKIRLDDWTSDFAEDELRLLPGFTKGSSTKGVLRLLWRASSNEAKARLQTLYSIQRKNGWSKTCQEIVLSPANQSALSHFDKYYTHIFGAATWAGVRAALLTPPARVFVLNSANPRIQEAVDAFRATNHLEVYHELARPLDDPPAPPPPFDTPEALDTQTGVVDDSSSLNRQFLVRNDAPDDQISEFIPPTEFISEKVIYTRDSDQAFVMRGDAELMRERDFELPMVPEESDCVHTFKKLRCFALPCGTFSALPRPKFVEDCFDFYPLDLGSVLVVLMLDVQPGTRMLDLCAAPGGKSIVALQTLNVERLMCTDVSETRLSRLRKVLSGFAFGLGDEVSVCKTSALHRKRRSGELFSRVLVDVPCSTDRDALLSPSGGYFARGKASARIRLPETQKTLLRNAMSLCEVGGYVVYSTCTLSTAQNQAVIESTLVDQNSSGGASFAVVDAAGFVERCASRLGRSLGLRITPVLHGVSGSAIGALVVPRIAANYGPTFMCKIKRIK